MKEFLSKSLQAILRPFVGLCVRHSVKLQDVVAILKVAFVDAARMELRRQGKEESVSRISVMTGVHRPDVTQIFKDGVPLTQPENLLMKVIAKWQIDKKFLTASGKPRVLSVDSKVSEFSELVSTVSATLNPYTVLFELERMEIVKRSSRGLKLISRVYNPRGNSEEQLQFLAKDLDDLIRTVEENVTDPQDPLHHHITTEYDNIPEEKLPEIRSWLFREGSAFHQKVRNYLRGYDRDTSHAQGAGRARVVLGSFSRADEFWSEQIEQKGDRS